MKFNPRIAFLIFNVLGLEITWGACAYGVINESPMLGVIVGSIYIIAHMLLTNSRRTDMLILLFVASAGILLDYINMRLGIVSFISTQQSFIPLWLIVLWAVFSLIIPHSLHWLRTRLLLASALGAIFGSFSYWLGHKLGAITLADPVIFNVLIYFIQWAIFMPLALIIYRIIIKNKTSSEIIQH